jgi:hypothetical protein
VRERLQGGIREDDHADGEGGNQQGGATLDQEKVRQQHREGPQQAGKAVQPCHRHQSHRVDAGKEGGRGARAPGDDRMQGATGNAGNDQHVHQANQDLATGEAVDGERRDAEHRDDAEGHHQRALEVTAYSVDPHGLPQPRSDGSASGGSPEAGTMPRNP